LFLGFLKGIPFFSGSLPESPLFWLLTIGNDLAWFYGIDKYNFQKETIKVKNRQLEIDEPEVSGLYNVVFLLIIYCGIVS